LQEFSDHREMRSMRGILLHEVGEVCRGDIEPLRQKLRDQQYDLGLVAQKQGGVLNFVDDRVGRGPDRRRVRLIQQHRHFAEHGAGLGQHGNHAVAPEDLETTVDQDKQMSGFAAFSDHERACRDVPLCSAGAVVQNGTHDSRSALDCKRKTRASGSDLVCGPTAEGRNSPL